MENRKQCSYCKEVKEAVTAAQQSPDRETVEDLPF